jgi:alpha-L-fucosidase 2
MDRALVWDLFTNTIEASTVLEPTPRSASAWQTRARLIPYQVGKRGQLQEWAEDFEEEDPTAPALLAPVRRPSRARDHP